MKKNILAATLAVSFILSSCVSNLSGNATNLMADIKSSNIPNIDNYDINDEGNSKPKEITEFSLNIFKESFKNDKNTLISPLSIISALGMTANGAKNETLSQMETVFTTNIQSLNNYLKTYLESLPSDDKYKVSLANSIWFKDKESLTVYDEFLQTNKDYYDSSIYKVLFDNSTKDYINNWVKDKTNNQIESILEEAPSENTIMYLINALSFDAEWASIYEDTNVRDGTFTLENGGEQDAEFMYSNEYLYLETENATGFIKPYKDDKYAFVALLPNKDVKLANFVNSLDTEKLVTLLENPEKTKVSTLIPKFSNEYSVLINETLKNLGMPDAFNADAADFSGLGKSTDGNIFISRVIHKTKINVDAKGTKAGAVTAVEMWTKSIREEPPKKVLLDRPFFYMIIDREQNLPLFIGTLLLL